MNIAAQHNLDKLQRSIALWARASGKTMEEGLKKKGRDLGYELAKEFATLMPEQGRIRNERLAALASGGGIHIRQRVYDKIAKKFNVLPVAGQMRFRSRKRLRGLEDSGLEQLGELKGSVRRKGKRLNIQALAAQAEINTRERGRGFMRQSARFAGAQLITELESMSRYNLMLASLRAAKDGETVTLTFGEAGSELSQSAVQAITRPRGRLAVNRAIMNVVADTMPFLTRKLGEDAVAAGFKV